MLMQFLKTVDGDWNPREEVSLAMLQVMWDKSHDLKQLFEVIFSENGLHVLEVDVANVFRDIGFAGKAFSRAAPALQLDLVAFVLAQSKNPLADMYGHHSYMHLAEDMLERVQMPEKSEAHYLRELIVGCLRDWSGVSIDIDNPIACIKLLQRLIAN